MGKSTRSTQETREDTPLEQFSNCHAGIVSHLHAFGELSALLGPAARARQIAEDMLASAFRGEEQDRVRTMVEQLVAQHRAIESQWTRLEPELRKVAKGQASALDADAVQHLVRQYQGHAAFEEREFLPLAHAILGRNSNHMAALGLSLHMRHAPPIMAHI
ncbi:hemerythrin domain-containing protein [Ramlibacter sp. 2FC]|uniref:hemerythrin domain-containing protein n=1 Tax=Ramlibacter sp. 2FC TaxID=2502188 RepID=UPI0010FA3F36|nr:hemerythrin domain-containing protein [Ramlibacter sp. 2FC]